MKARALVVLTGFCLIAAPCFGWGKHRSWQTGTLISVEAGVPGLTRAAMARTAAGYAHKLQIYTVETDTEIYEFSAYTGPSARDPHPLTIDHPVKFWLDSNKPERVLLLDEKGHAFKASLVRAVAKRSTR
jgi:hypothetical protein